MKINKYTYRNRRDFEAVYICENCDHETINGGYDDSHFHQNVIPSMVCEKCGESQNSLNIKSHQEVPRYEENQAV